MEPEPDYAWLGAMRRLIGMSRNHLAWILGVSPQLVSKWEDGYINGMDTEVMDAVENLRLDLDTGTVWLESESLTWDDVIPFRTAASKLGISQGTLQSMLSRKKINPINFGLLGLWLTYEDVALCRK